MTLPVPGKPKIYHIVHVDRLSSIAADGCLWCDATIAQCNSPGTTIGMNAIKQRRLQLPLKSHSDLHVGDCVPFYFCPRSVMLYVIYQSNHDDLAYKGGQDPIVHLEADFYTSVDWAEANEQRWAFTNSNASSYYFEDYCDRKHLSKINWEAVQAKNWSACKDGKQAEFLLENRFPWHLIERIGVYSDTAYQQAANALPVDGHRPKIEINRKWYC